MARGLCLVCVCESESVCVRESGRVSEGQTADGNGLCRVCVCERVSVCV